MFDIRAKSQEASELLIAAATGDLAYLEGASEHTLRNTFCNSGSSALHWAAGSDRIQVLQYLVSERNIPVDILAVKKSRGRTALHYACRNGCLRSAKWLVEKGGANPNIEAKNGVTPFQLAVWQNQLEICLWLVNKCSVDPCQLNVFACGAVHWMGICPRKDVDLIPMAKWLASLPGINFNLEQKQGHTALHKAAWGGHLALIKYLHVHQKMWDDSQDRAGNFAADLCDMANTPRHSEVAEYLRCYCSRARAESCEILGVEPSACAAEIRQAYRRQALKLHPDRQQPGIVAQPHVDSANDQFDKLHKAYKHLRDEGGRGNQSNPSHSLRRMLQLNGREDIGDHLDMDSCFKARLLAVILEYGDDGLDISNLKKKWKQVWPSTPFLKRDGSKKKLSLTEFLQEQAGEVVEIVRDKEKGAYRLYAKHVTKASLAKQ